MCQFTYNDKKNFIFNTNALLINEITLKCLPPLLNNIKQGKILFFIFLYF